MTYLRIPFSYIGIVVMFAYLAGGCSGGDARFKIISASESGIAFENQIDEMGTPNILDYLYYYNGGGVAIGDLNGDTLPDVYFVSNQGENKLYINQGNLTFSDHTERAGVSGQSDWQTGVSLVDINHDGHLDIYICAVVGIHGFNGHNELYINQGDGTFVEQSEAYGLDIAAYSSAAAFFDYDQDGGLDVYLLNHAVHTEEGATDVRRTRKRNPDTGDKLLRNDRLADSSIRFVDVSEQAGIYGRSTGYGLGVSVADFDMDGYPDVYVNNDFFEDDYYYLNQRDGTFKEVLRQHFGHTSKFSMGSDAGDLNGDGYPDLFTLDMLPPDEYTQKTSAGDDNPQTLRLRTRRYGYYYQYARNMLHINQYGTSFIEKGLLSGVAATDWSWGALIADYDHDGLQDIFVTNGIPRRPNDLDYIKYISNKDVSQKLNSKLIDNEAIEKMPKGEAVNAFFGGTTQGRYTDQSTEWVGTAVPTSSSGLAYGDLDQDGDLDLITNNINLPASVYINQTITPASVSAPERHYLTLSLRGMLTNPLGIGAKIRLYTPEAIYHKELYTMRGFQSSSEAVVHIGLGDETRIDSVVVEWSATLKQTFDQITIDQRIHLEYDSSEARPNYIHREKDKKSSPAYFNRIEENLGIDYTHRENDYVDYNRHKLIPYQLSDRSPALAVGDLNGDQLDDIYIGNAKYAPAALYVHTADGFEQSESRLLSTDSLTEDMSAFISDIDADGRRDLFVATGGGEYYGKSEPLRDRLYLHTTTPDAFAKATLPDAYSDAAVSLPYDYDRDGDEDILVGVAAYSDDFGEMPDSYFLRNTNGTFERVDHPALSGIGMVRDAVATDFDQDGLTDLIIVGEWMSPVFLRNTKEGLTDVSSTLLPSALGGLWQSIYPYDIDHDGDTDYLLGNWGLNSRLHASADAPMRMYHSDFDQNGRHEAIIAIQRGGEYYTPFGLEELTTQLGTGIRKGYPTYASFAGKSIGEILGKDALERATLQRVHTLASGYLRNDEGVFSFVPFDDRLQVSPIRCFAQVGEGVVCGGNYYGMSPYHGRMGGFGGAWIRSENEIVMGQKLGLDFYDKQVSKLSSFSHNGHTYLLAIINDAPAEVYRWQE